MKNTDEMVNSLFERRDQYLAEQNKRHKKRVLLMKKNHVTLIVTATIAFTLAVFALTVWALVSKNDKKNCRLTYI